MTIGGRTSATRPDGATSAGPSVGWPATETAAAVIRRNNVRLLGADQARPLVFVHGCSQAMWRHLVPAFAADHRVVLLDLVGHSVSAMIAVLAANRDPRRIGALVLVGPSPRYIDAPGYVGGFSRSDIDALLEGLAANHLGWSGLMALRFMGNPDQPEPGRELELSFCRTDPAIARHFASVAFLSDHRDDLAEVTVPTLVLQCSDDPVAPEAVGRFVHRTVPGSSYALLAATGHLPHLSGPAETAARIREFLERPDGR